MSLAVINAKSAWTASGRLFNAVFVVGSRIAVVGTTAEVMSRVEALSSEVKTVIIDLKHKFSLYPGFIDSHIHFMDGGRSLTALSLRACSSKAEFVAAIKNFVRERKVPAGSWIRGGEWSEVKLGGEPDKSWIDEATTEHLVFLYRFDLHSAVCSSTAIELAGISAASPNPQGGVIERDGNGTPTGVLRESAIGLVKTLWPKEDTAENNLRAAEAATQYLLSRGITTAFSMTSLSFSNVADTKFLIEMAKRRELKIRLRNAVAFDDVPILRALFDSDRSTPEQKPSSFSVGETDEARGTFLRLGAVKFFADGSLGSMTAAMTEPYHNDSCNCGVLCTTKEELESRFVETVSAGFQCCCHAIGDRALEHVVGGFEKCAAIAGEDVVRQLRLRVEHCQHVHDVSQLKRMAALDIVASVQPCHLLFDGDYVEKLIGLDRKNRSYLFGTMRENAVRVVFGSDWMVAPADVIDNLLAAVHRVPLGNESCVWNEKEKLSPCSALLAYTSNAAHSCFGEDEIGQIEPNFLADLSIWDGDLIDYLSQLSITRPRIAMTIVGGAVEFVSQLGEHLNPESN